MNHIPLIPGIPCRYNWLVLVAGMAIAAATGAWLANRWEQETKVTMMDRPVTVVTIGGEDYLYEPQARDHREHRKVEAMLPEGKPFEVRRVRMTWGEYSKLASRFDDKR
ncbi:hypothetical protein ABIC83_002850 [Roseateles asaccharophilus]|uniref:hypothetical protein n=1 Tax=Roseateles asaccharophilus TaxID=582607 RepID=UPI0038376CD8